MIPCQIFKTSSWLLNLPPDVINSPIKPNSSWGDATSAASCRGKLGCWRSPWGNRIYVPSSHYGPISLVQVWVDLCWQIMLRSGFGTWAQSAVSLSLPITIPLCRTLILPFPIPPSIRAHLCWWISVDLPACTRILWSPWQPPPAEWQKQLWTCCSHVLLNKQAGRSTGVYQNSAALSEQTRWMAKL